MMKKNILVTALLAMFSLFYFNTSIAKPQFAKATKIGDYPNSKTPCCTPVNRNSIANALKIVQNNGGLMSNYTLRMNPSYTFRQQMQAYINYIHWMSGGVVNQVFINWHMRECGTAVTPGTCSGIINGNHFTAWQFGGNGNYSNPGAGNFWPYGVMQVNHWYLIHTGTYLDKLSDRFINKKKCANNDIYVRVTVLKSARGGGKLEFSDGKRIIKSVRLKK